MRREDLLDTKRPRFYLRLAWWWWVRCPRWVADRWPGYTARVG